MLSKEEIEYSYIEQNGESVYSVRIPILTDLEKQKIDNNLDDIAKEYTKALLKEKDMVVAQYIIKKQQEKIEQLEAEKQELEKTNDKYLQKLVYALSPTDHLLDNCYNRSFKKIIAENIDLEICKIKKILKDCWEGRY